MNNTPEILSSSWAQALGWTLLHSLWQSFFVLTLIFLVLKFIPGRHAAIRYTLALSSLWLMLLLSISTFFSLNTPGHTISSSIFSAADTTPAIAAQAPSLINWMAYIKNSIQSNIPLIITIWITGCFLFVIRLAGSLWYVSALKRKAITLNGAWSERIHQLARQINIDRLVTLAESAQIQTPVVIGYLKPVILIPVGMFSGLSTAQIETIFIHELTHIKRHDYLMNVIQSFIEAVFFFNPFVWIVSGIIRREREHCCDDAVIHHHGDVKAYAYALAHLEEGRLTKTGLALSLANDKNELLNRIKRIMEKSVKNYSGRERIIPAVLLIVGLICASWLTITQGDRKSTSVNDEKYIASDTSIRKNKKAATYSWRKITTIGPDGKPYDQIIEKFEGDEDLRPSVDIDIDDMDMALEHPMPPIPDVDIAIPPIPDIDMAMPPMPDVDIAMMLMPDVNIAIPPMPPMTFSLDTIPGRGMTWKHSQDQDWEAFSEAFEKKFKENFGDFYETHQKDLEKMMQDLEHNFESQFDKQWAEKMEASARVHRDHAQKRLHMLAERERMRDREDFMRSSKEDMRERKEHMKHQKKEEYRMENPREPKKDKDALKHEEKGLKEIHKKDKQYSKEEAKHTHKTGKGQKAEGRQQFEQALEKELVKDGYLKSDEKIHNMHWDTHGDIEINGKKIKAADTKKYQKLRELHFEKKEKGIIEEQ